MVKAKVHPLQQADTENYLTVEEAARKMGVKLSSVRNYLSMGKITTYKFKSLTLVSYDDAKDWKKNHGRAT